MNLKAITAVGFNRGGVMATGKSKENVDVLIYIRNAIRDGYQDPGGLITSFYEQTYKTLSISARNKREDYFV